MVNIATVSLILQVLVFPVVSWSNQDFSQYENLKEPQINTMAQQKMLVVEAKGELDKPPLHQNTVKITIVVSFKTKNNSIKLLVSIFSANLVG